MGKRRTTTQNPQAGTRQALLYARCHRPFGQYYGVTPPVKTTARSRMTMDEFERQLNRKLNQ